MIHLDSYKSPSFLLAVVLSFCLLSGIARAGEFSDRLAWVGLDLFPTFLAADDRIDEKKDSDGKLHLLLIHRGRTAMAREMADQLVRVETIRGIPIRVSESMVSDLGDAAGDIPAGIFLVERMGDELGDVIQIGKESRAIVFSPFPGDVEKGVNSGMVISDRILPYVNIEAMRLSGIQMKSFFLRIAERYGE